MSDESNAPWQLQPASGRVRLVLAVTFLVLAVVLGVLLRQRSFDESLPAIAMALVVWVVLDRLMHRHRVRVGADGLEVVTSAYRRRLGWSELQLESARVIDIDEHPERKPRFKTNGMSVFGFNGGSFRSRDLTKLFVAVAGGKRLLWLPTTQGYTLLLEPRRPQALLERLRELAPPPPRR